VGNELALDHCDQCGGVWGEEGRLQKAFGKAAEPMLRGGDTHRRCVLCRILLTPAVLPGGLSVEVCSACRGLFLDAGEFEKLGGHERAVAGSGIPKPPVAPRPPVAPPAPPKVPTVAPAPVVNFSSAWNAQAIASPGPATAQEAPPAVKPTKKQKPASDGSASPEAAQARRQKPAPPAPEQAAPQEAPEVANTFACVQCGKRVPFREGQAYREGLACRSCMRALLGV
jgi:Zn-finger nucleic acid-binding protein